MFDVDRVEKILLQRGTVNPISRTKVPRPTAQRRQCSVKGKQSVKTYAYKDWIRK